MPMAKICIAVAQSTTTALQLSQSPGTQPVRFRKDVRKRLERVDRHLSRTISKPFQTIGVPRETISDLIQIRWLQDRCPTTSDLDLAVNS